MLKKNIVCFFCISLSMVIIYGCSDKNGTQSGQTDYYETLESYFQHLHNKRYSDSLLKVARKFFYSSGQEDTLKKIYSATYAATEYLYIENMDSVDFYLKYLYSMYDKFAGMPLEVQVLKISGFYEMKAERNFYSGIEQLIKSYELALSHGSDKEEIIISLANIVEFFYIRSDISGIYYAEKAYETAKRCDIKWAKYAASVCMAEMLSLSSMPEDAIPYIREAETLAKEGKWEMVSYAIPLTYATVLEKEGDSSSADSLYMKALEYSGYEKGEPYNTALVCLKYGEFLKAEGNYDKAAHIYEYGISVGSNLLMDKLLMNMAECAAQKGDRNVAMVYFEKYLAFRNSYNIASDVDADRLVSYYREAKQELEVRGHELELIAARRKLALVILALAIIAGLFVFAIVSDRKQRRINKMLILRYQNYVRAEEESAKKKDEANENQLWNRIEQLMKQDKLYRQKGLTLESMTKYAGTNRTYLSKAINHFSGKNFTGYVDSYRIKEAVKIIETSEESVPFKIISDAVGYSNDSVFYKAFLREIGVSPGKYRNEVLHDRKKTS